MRTYRTLDAIEEEYFTNHPEEIDDYLNEIFAEYAKNGNSTALFSSLRVIAGVKGINRIPTHAATFADDSALEEFVPKVTLVLTKNF